MIMEADRKKNKPKTQPQAAGADSNFWGILSSQFSME